MATPLNDKLEVLADGCRPLVSEEELDTDTSLVDCTARLSDEVRLESLDLVTMPFDEVVEPLEIRDSLFDIGDIVEDDAALGSDDEAEDSLENTPLLLEDTSLLVDGEDAALEIDRSSEVDKL